MKKYILIIMIIIVAVVVTCSFFIGMRYLAYKSPSTILQGQASHFEEKIFGLIDKIRGKN